MSPSIIAWRCTVCGYIHKDSDPPDTCPVCGAGKEEFESVWDTSSEDADSAASSSEDASSAAPHVVVVGAGVAGISAAEAIRQASPSAQITLITQEDALPYYRLNLTRFLAGEIQEQELPIHPASWYSDHRIDVMQGAEVTDCSLDRKCVLLKDGSCVSFDRLIVTTGAQPFVPPLPGAGSENVVTLRTLKDAKHILDLARPGSRCVCVGGGLLGLETAGALAKRGVDVSLLEGGEWLMPRQLNRRAGEILMGHVKALGIRLYTQARPEEIVGEERATGVRIQGGLIVPADLVIIATGVRPNAVMAQRAGLQVHQGVVVNDYLQTSHPDVYAAGDAAEHQGLVYGTWVPSQYQGSIAGLNAAGQRTLFGGISRSNTLKVLGVDTSSVGSFEPEGSDSLVLEHEDDGQYCRFVFKGSWMVGAVLINRPKSAAAAKKAVENKTDFSEFLSRHPTGQDVTAHLETLSA